MIAYPKSHLLRRIWYGAIGENADVTESTHIHRLQVGIIYHSTQAPEWKGDVHQFWVSDYLTVNGPEGMSATQTTACQN